MRDGAVLENLTLKQAVTAVLLGVIGNAIWDTILWSMPHFTRLQVFHFLLFLAVAGLGVFFGQRNAVSQLRSSLNRKCDQLIDEYTDLQELARGEDKIKTITGPLDSVWGGSELKPPFPYRIGQCQGLFASFAEDLKTARIPLESHNVRDVAAMLNVLRRYKDKIGRSPVTLPK